MQLSEHQANHGAIKWHTWAEWGTSKSLPDCLLLVKVTHSNMSQAHVGPQLGLYFGSDASFSSLIWHLSIRRSILRHIFKCTLLTLFFPLHCDIPVVDSSRRNFHGLPTSALLGNLNSTRLQRAVEKTYRNLLPQEV